MNSFFRAAWNRRPRAQNQPFRSQKKDIPAAGPSQVSERAQLEIPLSIMLSTLRMKLIETGRIQLKGFLDIYGEKESAPGVTRTPDLLIRSH